jgi:hypothetical protein
MQVPAHGHEIGGVANRGNAGGEMFWVSHAMNELTAELNGAVWDAAASSVIDARRATAQPLPASHEPCR